MYCSVLVVFLVMCGINSQLYPGDDCVLEEDGKPGICILLKHCQRAVVGLSQHPKVFPQNCGFQADDVVVCCPVEDQPVTPVVQIGKSALEPKNIVPTRDDDDNITTKKCDEFTSSVRNLLTHDVTPLIVGGENATNGQYPHMAALGYGDEDDIQWSCGGSLISEKFILTAGHCIQNPNLGNVTFARLGDVSLDGTSNTGRDYRIIRRIPHENYKPPFVYNDIALVELHRRVRFTPYIKPACLFSHPDTNVLNKRSLEATGWGLVETGGPRSKYLLTVRLPIYPFEDCVKKFGTNRRHNKGLQADTQMCVGGVESKDTCQGDSGGPVQVYLYTKRLHCIVGVTSFGKACGIKDIPGVYTKVSYYVPWIEKIVWPN